MNFEEEAERLLDAFRTTHTDDEVKLTIVFLEKAFSAGHQEGLKKAMAIIEAA